MNRIQQDLMFHEVLSEAACDDVSSAAFRPAGQGTNCALFVPLHYEENYAYPLLVWLHGPRDSEQQLKRIMPLVSMRNYVAVAPRGPVAGDSAETSNRWSWSESPRYVATAEQRAVESIEFAQRKLKIAGHRIFLAGFGCGGSTALRLAMMNPRRYAGVLSLGGGFPSGRTPLCRLTEARRMPIFLACGQQSQRYPLTTVCENLRLLHSGGMDVSLRVYPCGDELSPHMLPDMDRWIMEQIAGAGQQATRARGTPLPERRID